MHPGINWACTRAGDRIRARAMIGAGNVVGTSWGLLEWRRGWRRGGSDSGRGVNVRGQSW
jgi:hypothetical protein